MNVELSHQQAVNRLKDIQDELERLHGKPELTDEDRTYWTALTTESAEVAAHAERLALAADLERVRVAAAVPARADVGALRTERGSDRGEVDRDIMDPAAVEDRGTFRNPYDLSEMRTFNRSREEITGELRGRALSAIETMPGLNSARREAATAIVEEHEDKDGTISKHVLYTGSPEYLRAFAKAAQGRESTFTAEERAAVERAMSLTDAAGGFLVPFQLDPTVIITSAGSRNDIRQAARQVVATGDIWNGVSSTAVSWSWDAEADEVSDDTTTFAGPAIPVFKGAGFVPISLEAMADAPNVAQEVGRLLLFGKDTLEATAFATGNGTSAPQGIITGLAGTASELNAAADDTFAIGDVYTTEGSLPARYRPQASWLANNSIYNLIRRFDTSGGGGFWTNIGQGRPSELLGRPALEAEGMDSSVTTTGAANNYILVFGDFENYVIADRIGVTVEFIPHLFHTGNNRPSGSRGWYAYFRVGAEVVNVDGFRLLDVPSAA